MYPPSYSVQISQRMKLGPSLLSNVVDVYQMTPGLAFSVYRDYIRKDCGPRSIYLKSARTVHDCVLSLSGITF